MMQSRANVNASRRKELTVIKDLKYKPYTFEQNDIFDEIVEIVGTTTEDTQGNWLSFGDSCDPDYHKDALSNKYVLAALYHTNVTKKLCSIFEDLACDTVEKICKCWTAGGVGRMEWQPDFVNERKPLGRCIMTSRQRCGTLDMPPGLYPHVDFPMLRRFKCDEIRNFTCMIDTDGVTRCTDSEHLSNSGGQQTSFIFSSNQLYKTAITLFVWVSYF